MTREKQHVFSARTTKKGLRLLNGLMKERNIGWDDLVIDAVCAHYGLDKLVMALPKAYRLGKKTEEEKRGGQQSSRQQNNPQATRAIGLEIIGSPGRTRTYTVV